MFPKFDDKTKKITSKAAVTGAALYARVFGGNNNVNVLGYSMPVAVPMFLAGAGASVASDVVHSYVNPELGTAQAKLGNISATALGVGIAAASSLSSHYLDCQPTTCSNLQQLVRKLSSCRLR